MELRGRVALVTGAGRRLGRAIAYGLAEQGMSVAMHHHQSVEDAQRLRAKIRRQGGVAECFPADLADARQARDLPVQVAAQWGRLDVLINSAGIMKRLTVEETTPEVWDQIMNVNLRAYSSPRRARSRRCGKPRARSSTWPTSGVWSRGPATPPTASARPGSSC